MKCEKCASLVKRTLADNCVSKINRYKTVAYYCDTCDDIFIIEKYKGIIDKHKYDKDLIWLREQNPNLR